MKFLICQEFSFEILAVVGFDICVYIIIYLYICVYVYLCLPCIDALTKRVYMYVYMYVSI